MPADRPRAPRGGQRHPRPGRRPGPGRGPAARTLRPAAPPVASRDRSRPRLTGRAAILVIVLAVLAVSYASSLRAYLDQRSHIADLKDQIAEKRASIEELAREKSRWDDEAFVRQQARQRLSYLTPGETSYVMLGEDGEPIESQTELTDPATLTQEPPAPVYADVWASVKLAGDPPRQEPPPASRLDGSEDPTEQ